MPLRTIPAPLYGTADIEVLRSRDDSDAKEPLDVVTIRVEGHEFDLDLTNAAALSAGITHALVL